MCPKHINRYIRKKIHLYKAINAHTHIYINTAAAKSL